MNLMYDQPIRLVYALGILLVCLCGSPGAAQHETDPSMANQQSASSKINTLFTPPRRADYEQAKQKAYHWLNHLHVDPVELVNAGYKGKKILAEILDVYVLAYRHTTDQDDRLAFYQRITELAQQAQRSSYHNMQTNSDLEFRRNAISYLRVHWLLKYMQLDTATYQSQIQAIQPRLDQFIPGHGPWVQAMYQKYYKEMGLSFPPNVSADPLQNGLIANRLPLEKYTRILTYHLTHEIYVLFEYGFRYEPNAYSSETQVYLYKIIPPLVARATADHNVDLLAELVSCMTYLGWQEHPAYHRSINFILDNQNPTGTWGRNYESRRQRYGAYLDQNLYLHTVLVTLRALTEIYEGAWPNAAALKVEH